MEHARHLEKLPILEPDRAQPSAPDAAGIDAQQILLQMQAEGRPVTEGNGDVAGQPMLVFEPGFVRQWL